MKLIKILPILFLAGMIPVDASAGECAEKYDRCPSGTVCVDAPDTAYGYNCEFQESEAKGFEIYNVETGGLRLIDMSFATTFETVDMCNTFSLVGDFRKIESSNELYFADLHVIKTKMRCTTVGRRRITLKSEYYTVKLEKDVGRFSVLVPSRFSLKRKPSSR